MIAAAMIVVGLALLLAAIIPQAWEPLGRIVLTVNTVFAAFGARVFAQLLRKDEDDVQQFLVKAARVVLGALGVMLILSAATYASTG